MALSPCNTTVDQTNRELVEHGTSIFPFACYHDDLSKGEVPWHWHDEWEAVVVSEGVCTIAAGKEKYLIHQGEGFFINSGVLHGCWDVNNSGCRFHSLVFHPRLIGGGIDSVIDQQYVQALNSNKLMESIHLKPTVGWHREALDAIEKSWQAGVREPYGYEVRIRDYLSEMMLTLLEHIRTGQKNLVQRELRDAERIKQMIQYIHDHYDQEIKVQDIAQRAAISVSECLRCFRHTIGTTPIQYVRQYRIQKAAMLLRLTDTPVAEISQLCGFQDLSYFTRVFRETKGCGPAAYRRQEKGPA